MKSLSLLLFSKVSHFLVTQRNTIPVSSQTKTRMIHATGRNDDVNKVDMSESLEFNLVEVVKIDLVEVWKLMRS